MSSATIAATFTLVGALGGSILTGLIAAWRTERDHRHERQMKELDSLSAANSARLAERRQIYEEFIPATDGIYQLAADLFTRARDGESIDFRAETRGAVSELMQRYLRLALVATTDVRIHARDYVGSLRDLLIKSSRGQWSDETTLSRNTLFASMIHDVNPGHEPSDSQSDVSQPHVPPPAVNDGDQLPGDQQVHPP